MYLSPRSQSIVTTMPDGSIASTTRSAANRLAPEEIPTKSPVSFANDFAFIREAEFKPISNFNEEVNAIHQLVGKNSGTLIPTSLSTIINVNLRLSQTPC